MANAHLTSTVAIDTQNSLFHFYTMPDGNTVTHYVKSYSGSWFDGDFYGKFRNALREFAEKNPTQGVRKITLLLPDSAVLTDAIKIPVVRSGLSRKKNHLESTLRGLYRNYADLRIIAHPAAQTRTHMIYAVTAVQKGIVTSLYSACSENKMLVDTLSTNAAATVCAAAQLDTKLKNKSYLFLDLNGTYAKFVFVADGKAVGGYTLPFGLEFLRKGTLVGEDMLFDHSYAELSIINAREKAKFKKLTVLAPDAVAEEENGQEEISAEETADETEQMHAENGEAEAFDPFAKVFRKKARKLPKFMQREIPETEEGILYENFRIFVKWALTLIAGNEKLTELGKPEFVCVNLPDDLAPVLEKVNEEAEENGIRFVALHRENAPERVVEHLALYGGLFPKSIGRTGRF